MKSLSSTRKQIFIRTNLRGTSGRKILAGVQRFIVSNNANWDLSILSENNAEYISLRDISFDGYIGLLDDATADILSANKTPSVIFGAPGEGTPKRHLPNCLHLTENNYRIGQIGADFLVSLGKSAAFGFVSAIEADDDWCQQRKKGFADRLAKFGLKCNVHSHDSAPLAEWLKSLPKPASIMVSHDMRAKEVVTECHRINIEIPRQIAVLGVDNDQLFCESSRPTLSTIPFDHDDFGYQAARLLERLFRKRKPIKKCIYRMRFDRPIIERESTAPISPMTTLVERIDSYLDAHFTEQLSIEDIVRAVGVSRRLVFLRYAQAKGTTIRKFLETKRLDYAKRQLETTALPIAKISRLAGYKNIQRLKYVFRAHFGITMSSYRRKFKGCPEKRQG